MNIRKIIHIDMDCFYAAIEMRDQPHLKHQPIAVGGLRDRRGVLCTCNYQAREYGVHSAMPTAIALRLCPDLIVLPVNMKKYKQESTRIQQIFHYFTDRVEPLSLDEAYLDVSQSPHYQGSATLIAKAIREKIFDVTGLTASAGIANSKYLAKVASDWNKPNGIFLIKPSDIDTFVKKLAVRKIPGVGKVTEQRLVQLGIKNCSDLQAIPRHRLIAEFASLGERLYQLARGIDHREVITERLRKSLSVEETYPQDLSSIGDCIANLDDLYAKLIRRLENMDESQTLQKQFVKLKFHDFHQTTVECLSTEVRLNVFSGLLHEAFLRRKQRVRLIGLGVRFSSPSSYQQLEIPYIEE